MFQLKNRGKTASILIREKNESLLKEEDTDWFEKWPPIGELPGNCA
jgi:hypothetical protein